MHVHLLRWPNLSRQEHCCMAHASCSAHTSCSSSNASHHKLVPEGFDAVDEVCCLRFHCKDALAVAIFRQEHHATIRQPNAVLLAVDAFERLHGPRCKNSRQKCCGPNCRSRVPKCPEQSAGSPGATGMPMPACRARGKPDDCKQAGRLTCTCGLA